MKVNSIRSTHLYIILLSILILLGLVAQFFSSQNQTRMARGAESVISIQKIHADTPELVSNFYLGEQGAENALIKHQNLLERQIRKLSEQASLYKQSLSVTQENANKNSEESAIIEVGNGWFALSQLIASLLDVSSELTTQNNTKRIFTQNIDLLQSSVDELSRALERESRLGKKVSEALNYVDLVAKVAQMKNTIASFVETKNDMGTNHQAPNVLAQQFNSDLSRFEASIKHLEAEADLVAKTKLFDVEKHYRVLANAVASWGRSSDVLNNAHVVRQAVDQRSQDFSQQLAILRQVQESQNNYQWISWLAYLLPLIAALLLLFRGKSHVNEIATLGVLTPQKAAENQVVAQIGDEDIEDALIQKEANEQELFRDIEELRAEKINLESALSKAEEEILQFSSNEENASNEIDQLLEKLEKAEANIAQKTTALEEVQNDADVLRNENHKLEAKNSTLQNDGFEANEASEKSLNESAAQIAKLTESLNQSNADFDELKTSSEKVNTENLDKIVELNDELTNVNQQLLELNESQETENNHRAETVEKLEKTLKDKQLEMDDLADESARLKQECLNYEEKAAELPDPQEFKSLNRKVESLEAQLAQDRQSLKSAKQELEENRTHFEVQTELLNQQKTTAIDEAANEKEHELRLMKDDFESSRHALESQLAELQRANTDLIKQAENENQDWNAKFLNQQQASEAQIQTLMLESQHTQEQSLPRTVVEQYAAKLMPLRAGDLSVKAEMDLPPLDKIAESISDLASQLNAIVTGVKIASEDIDDVSQSVSLLSQNTSNNDVFEKNARQLNQSVAQLSQLKADLVITAKIFEKTALASNATLDIADSSVEALDRSKRLVLRFDRSLEKIQNTIENIAEPLESLSDKTSHIHEVVSLVKQLSVSAREKFQASDRNDSTVKEIVRRNIEMTDSFFLAAEKMSDSIDLIRQDTNVIASELDDNLKAVSYGFEITHKLESEFGNLSEGSKQISRLHNALRKHCDEEKQKVDGFASVVSSSVQQIQDANSVSDSIALNERQAGLSVDEKREQSINRLAQLKQTLLALVERYKG